VLLFSAALLALAVALPQFAGLAGGRAANRASLVAAGGATLSSIANLVEDGVQLEWAFFPFIWGIAVLDVGLLALAMAIALESALNAGSWPLCRQRRWRPSSSMCSSVVS